MTIDVDRQMDRAAAKLQRFAQRMASEGGLKAKLAQPLAEDADLLRKLKPSLVKARAKGDAPTDGKAPSGPQLGLRPQRTEPSAGGPNPWLVVGAAFVAGVVLARVIAWRGNAESGD